MSRLRSVQDLNLDSNRTILQWHQRNRRLQLVVTDEMPSSDGPRVKHKLRAQHFNTGITSCNQEGIVRQVWRHKSYVAWTECTGCVVYQMKQPNPRKSPCNVLIDKYLLLHTLFPPLCKGFWEPSIQSLSRNCCADMSRKACSQLNLSTGSHKYGDAPSIFVYGL